MYLEDKVISLSELARITELRRFRCWSHPPVDDARTASDQSGPQIGLVVVGVEDDRDSLAGLCISNKRDGE